MEKWSLIDLLFRKSRYKVETTLSYI